MVRLYEISSDDLNECLDAIKYVVDKKGQVIDEPMVEMLTDIHERVSGHVHNENKGTLTDTLSQIDMIQNVLGKVEDD